SFPLQARESGLDFAFAAGANDPNRHPQAAGGRLRFLQLKLVAWIRRIPEHTDDGGLRDEIVEKPEAFGVQIARQYGGASAIAARSAETRYVPLPDWIAAGHENDRDACGQRHHDGIGAGADRDQRHTTLDQIGRERRQSIILILCPTIFDRQILALDKAGFQQALTECRRVSGRRSPGRRPRAQESNHRHRRLLRPRRDRPRRRTAEQGYELASPHAGLPPASTTGSVYRTVSLLRRARQV